MKTNRSYLFSMTVTGTVTLTPEQVSEITASFNRALTEKRFGWQMLSNVTGGKPVDSTNFDAAYSTVMRAGMRRAVREGALEDFQGLERAQATVDMEPKGVALSVEGPTNE